MMFKWLKRLLRKLTHIDLAPREKKTIIWRYIKGESQNDLCREYGLTQYELCKMINNSRLYQNRHKRGRK